MLTTKTTLRKRIDEFCEENWPDEEILLFGGEDGDPYDKGLIGIGFQQHKGPVAVYDREKCIEALAKEFTENATGGEDADPYVDAVEWFDFNTAGAWVGGQTPIIISRFQ
jgi:hypothetical protein|tara:strand:+ start:274 stop:603 length:330 start_codon:yes stop_codon:yes gene_type:complete